MTSLSSGTNTSKENPFKPEQSDDIPFLSNSLKNRLRSAIATRNSQRLPDRQNSKTLPKNRTFTKSDTTDKGNSEQKTTDSMSKVQQAKGQGMNSKNGKNTGTTQMKGNPLTSVSNSNEQKISNTKNDTSGKLSNTSKNISSSLIVPKKQGEMQSSAFKHSPTNKVLSQSLPNKLKDEAKGPANRNKPLVDGVVDSSKLQRNSAPKSDMQKPTEKANNMQNAREGQPLQNRSKQQAKTPRNQEKELQKTQQGQTPRNQEKELQKFPQGQTPRSQVNDLQKSKNQVHMTRGQESDLRKSVQKALSARNQESNLQQSQKQGQTPRNQENNLQKSQKQGQTPRNQESDLRKSLLQGQKQDQLLKSASKLPQGGQKPDQLPTSASKTQQGSPSVKNQANITQKINKSINQGVQKQNGPIKSDKTNSTQLNQVPGSKLGNNSQKSKQDSNIQPQNGSNKTVKQNQPQTGKNQAGQKPGQKIDVSTNNNTNTRGNMNSKNQTVSNRNDISSRSQGQNSQLGKPKLDKKGDGNLATPQGDKRKKKNKEVPRRPTEPRPQIIEHHAGATTITLKHAQSILKEIEEMQLDPSYGTLALYLSKMLQKVQSLETGNYTRTEVELAVRQFQDYNEGFNYRMATQPRGHALILLNTEFYKVPGDPFSYELEDRLGAEIDGDNMESLFTDMGYLVTRRDNIKHWEMAYEMKRISELDHKKFDSFICVISSHGNLNQVFGCDGLKMTLSKEIRLFNGDMCPTLSGKPKIFFIQSCQTELDEQSFRTESALPVEGEDKPKQGELEKSKFLINDVDFLVGYSTIPGNQSYRYEHTGSWYLNALHENLKENYKKSDLVSLLEDVNFDVNRKRDQYSFPDSSSQVSMFSSTLRGPLFFQ